MSQIDSINLTGTSLSWNVSDFEIFLQIFKSQISNVKVIWNSDLTCNHEWLVIIHRLKMPLKVGNIFTSWVWSTFENEVTKCFPFVTQCRIPSWHHRNGCVDLWANCYLSVFLPCLKLVITVGDKGMFIMLEINLVYC